MACEIRGIIEFTERFSSEDLNIGNQQVWNENRDKCIVFSGELYAYESLKSKLIESGHIFSTNSDAEIVLHAYEEYDKSCFIYLEGVFAFAIFTLSTQALFIARDRIGEKPLFYYHSESEFVFASKMKELMSIGGIKQEVNRLALLQYFQLTYIPAPLTIFENVYKMLPATWMQISRDATIETGTYWDVSCKKVEILDDYNSCKEMLREAVFCAVENRMAKGMEVGAFISGGIDSTIVSGIMAKISGKPINTFTIGFPEKQYDESNLAAIVAKNIGASHHVLQLDWKEAHKNIIPLIEDMDEPFADSSLIAAYSACKIAKEFVPSVLTGDSADELFAGYEKYLIAYYADKYKMLPKFVRQQIVKPTSDLMPSQWRLTRKVRKVIRCADKNLFEQRREMMCLGLKDDELQQVFSWSSGMDVTSQLVRSYYERLEDVEEITRAQYVDLKVVLEGDMLPKVDRACSLAAFTSRVPFLDSRVVDLVYKMPSKFKIKGKQRKIILKDAFADLIPPEILAAPKHGFAVPMSEWLRTLLKEQLLAYAAPAYLDEQGIFQSEYINVLIMQHLSKKHDSSSVLWCFYVFQHWYQNNFSPNRA